MPARLTANPGRPSGKIAPDAASADAVHVAETSLAGEFRYVRLAFAARNADTTLTLAELEVWGD